MVKIFIALFIISFNSIAFADCIDESNISDDYVCIEIWSPVCGCDGIREKKDYKNLDKSIIANDKASAYLTY